MQQVHTRSTRMPPVVALFQLLLPTCSPPRPLLVFYFPFPPAPLPTLTVGFIIKNMLRVLALLGARAGRAALAAAEAEADAEAANAAATGAEAGATAAGDAAEDDAGEVVRSLLPVPWGHQPLRLRLLPRLCACRPLQPATRVPQH